MNCAIIGSTKIASTCRTISPEWCKEITFISRSIQKRRKMVFKLKKNFLKINYFYTQILIY